VLEGKDPGEAFAGGVDIRTWVLAGLPPVFGLGHEGPSSLTGVDKGAPAFDCDAQGSEDQEPPAPPCQHLTTDPAVDPIEELRSLLWAHPVTIESTEKRLRIIEAPGRRNWEKSRHISQLVFFNKDVFDYLVQHPDRMISGRNL